MKPSTWRHGATPRLTSLRVRRLGSSALVAMLMAALCAAPALANQGLVEPEKMPGPLKAVSIDQHLGDLLPLTARLTDETGTTVELGDYFGERPVILAFVYYECPMLCSLILNGLASSLGVVKFTPGEDFDVVAISIDHDETPQMAREVEQATLARYGRPETDAGWHFLTGDQTTVKAIADVAGFGYEYLPESDEYAHASAIMVVTPEGQLAQYFYGVEYPPKDLRLAMVEASNNKLGSLVDQLLLYCYRYDPTVGQYTAVTMRILRIVGGAFCIVLFAFVWIAFRRDRAALDAPSPTLGAA